MKIRRSFILAIILYIIPVDSLAFRLHKVCDLSRVAFTRTKLMQRPMLVLSSVRWNHGKNWDEARARAHHEASIIDQFSNIKMHFNAFDPKLKHIYGIGGGNQIIIDLKKHYQYQLPLAQAHRDLVERVRQLNIVIETAKDIKDNEFFDEASKNECADILWHAEREHFQLFNALKQISEQPEFVAELQVQEMRNLSAIMRNVSVKNDEK